MKLKQAVKSIQRGKGVVRCIDKNGKVISENWNTGLTVDFISAEYLIKIGELESPHNEKVN
jgi:hypothetical protein